MKNLLLLSLITLLVVTGCSSNERDILTNSNTTTTNGTLKVYATTTNYAESFFNPPDRAMPDNINLTVVSVQLRKADDSLEWITVAEPNQTYDFLQLVNGVTAELASVAIEPGRYTMLRLILAETNEIIFDGTSESLTVPSGTKTGVKFSFDVIIEGTETLTATVVFDASTSIVSTRHEYLLRPAFRLLIDSE